MSTEIKNCDQNSIIKVLPNSWLKINKNCELEMEICHNTTKMYVPQTDSVVVYQGSITVFNFTYNLNDRDKNQKIFKGKNQELIKTIMVMNGVRGINKTEIGVRCYNNSRLKYENSAKTIKLLAMTSKNGEMFKIIDKASLNVGQSCIKTKLVAQKY